VQHWGRLHLPNSQYVRTTWKEIVNNVSRMSRNVKFMFDARLRYREVLYFFRHKVNNYIHTLAVISLYSLENAFLLSELSGTVWACQAQGDNTLIVINVKTILTCVAMIPHMFSIPDANSLQLYLAMDKLGIDIGNMRGVGSGDDNSDDDNDHDNDEVLHQEKRVDLPWPDMAWAGHVSQVRQYNLTKRHRSCKSREG
ncbi:hypothetical protein HETIRDRAFT_43206, partial [Heterobasidion irregulare TC 32-1]